MVVTLDDLNKLPDILATDRFEFLFTVPNVGTADKLNLKCKSVKFGGAGEIEPIKIELFGHAVNFRGRKISGHSFTAVFYEDSYMDTMKFLRSCIEVIHDDDGNSVGLKPSYAFDAQVVSYDTIGNVAGTSTYVNTWVSKVEGVDLDGSSSTPVEISVDFVYDTTKFTFGR